MEPMQSITNPRWLKQPDSLRKGAPFGNKTRDGGVDPHIRPRRSRESGAWSKMEGERLVARDVPHGRLIDRFHQHIAQLDPTAQPSRSLPRRAGPAAAGEGTGNA